jgi:outer membrane protein OmpA-like peptidoglycan-associated protein
LQSWFSGTPVLIAQRDDGPLSVDVPLEFCFDMGRSDIKPPLGVVLDKVAESLRRTPKARLQLVAAPGDTVAASPLAKQRAAQVRKHLLSRGVPAAHLGYPTASTVAAVQLRMDLASQ